MLVRSGPRYVLPATIADHVSSKRPWPVVVVAALFEGGLGVLAAGLAWLFGLSLAEQMPVDGRQIAWGIVATLPMLAAYWAMNGSRRRPFRRIRSQVEWLANELFPTGSIVAIAIIALLAGIGEEALFRGVLQPLAERWSTPWLGPTAGVVAGLLVASLVFGAVHWISTLYFVLATVVGLYFGILAIAFDSITAPIVAHALYDFIVLVIITRQK